MEKMNVYLNDGRGGFTQIGWVDGDECIAFDGIDGEDLAISRKGCFLIYDTENIISLAEADVVASWLFKNKETLDGIKKVFNFYHENVKIKGEQMVLKTIEAINENMHEEKTMGEMGFELLIEAYDSLIEWQEGYESWLNGDNPDDIEFPDSNQLLDSIENFFSKYSNKNRYKRHEEKDYPEF